MKRALILLALHAAPAFAYERLRGPTELLYCSKTNALPGNTLFGVGNRTFLLDLDGRVGSGMSISNYPGRLNANIPGLPVQRDWLHCNGLDYNQDLDQIAINSVRGEFYVIDHGNTFIAGNPSGRIGAFPARATSKSAR